MPAPQSLLSAEPIIQDGLACSGADSAADDLPALALVKVPDWGQPFDGDPLTAQTSATAAGQSGYGWDEASSTATAKEAGAKAEGTAAGEAEGTADGDEVANVTGPRQAEASGQWAQQFARLLAEALAGARPVRQIQPWTSERARAHLDRLAPLFGGGQRPRVLRVITTWPTRQVIEMTVIVGIGMRTHALAVRLEQAASHRLAGPAGYGTRDRTSLASGHRWVCTDIEAA
jgi:hypothetical protein